METGRRLDLTVEQRAELSRRVGAAPTSEWAAGMPWAAISDSMRFDIARAGPRTGCRSHAHDGRRFCNFFECSTNCKTCEP